MPTETKRFKWYSTHKLLLKELLDYQIQTIEMNCKQGSKEWENSVKKNGY
jgi:hypothetical protein